MFQQADAVVAEIAQRRYVDGEHRKAVVQVGAESVLRAPPFFRSRLVAVTMRAEECRACVSPMR
jgi:hypothetical protein